MAAPEIAKRHPCPRCELYVNPSCHGPKEETKGNRPILLQMARDFLATYPRSRVHAAILTHYVDMTRCQAAYTLRQLKAEGDLREFKRAGRRVVYEVVS